MRRVGPAGMAGPEVEGEYELPLATLETPLFSSVKRGARVTRENGGLRAVVLDARMTRSVLVEADDAVEAAEAARGIAAEFDRLEDVVRGTSRYCRLLEIRPQVVGRLLYLRLAFFTGDAAGHNMSTQAAEAVLNDILERRPGLCYGSISANLCTDKKPSAVNGLLGRGISLVADMTIPHEACESVLKTSAEAVARLNERKNLLGTALAGGVRSGNAHFANMLLAFYLATGQDAANVVEGSQGFTTAEAREEGLYFSVTLPSLIVGTVGPGPSQPYAQDNLATLGCREEREPGANARRLAVFCAAAVWCGELSLLAAQTVPGELMRAHRRMERRGRGKPET
ncbi:hydroxymethylglutaryl-CoA reductase [Kiritimatiella glycovorans]